MGVLLAGGEKIGLVTAVRALQAQHVAGARRADGSIEAQQLPLLPVAEAEDAAGSAELVATEAKGPGRPKGARNLSTQEMLDYLGKRYRPPLVVLAETYSRPARLLAAELGIDVVEAYQLQQHAAIASLPYWHKKQATDVDLGDGTQVTLVINNIQAPAQPAKPGDAAVVIEAEILPLPSEQNQRLSDSDAGELVKPQLVNSGQAVEDAAQSPDRALDQTSAARGEE